jgi:hypothetical protein
MQQQQQLDYVQLGHAHSFSVLRLFHISYVTSTMPARCCGKDINLKIENHAYAKA